MHNIVLVGAGHTHVQVLKAFAENPPPAAKLTLVVDTPIAVYSGMVPGFVARQYRAAELQIDAAALALRAGAKVVVRRAVEVDPEQRRIILHQHAPIPYDIASFDIGSTVAGLDLPGVREHALPTRPIGLFVEQVDTMIQAARRHNSDAPFRTVIVGGGAGGVELAFASQSRLKVDASAATEVTLLDSASQILAGYPDRLVARIYRLAEQRGIEILGHHKVAGIEENNVAFVDGNSRPFDVLIWVTGAASQPLFRQSRLATDRRGFVCTRSTLQLEEYDNLFACGDCGSLIDYPDTPKAGVYAVRQGPVLTGNIRALVTGEPLECYAPQRDFLTLLNLGDGTAVGTKWGITIAGRWVMKLKDRIDRGFMRQFQVSADPSN